MVFKDGMLEMAKKSFKVLFYTTKFGSNDLCLRDCGSSLTASLKSKHLPKVEFEENNYQIRDLVISESEWRGVFGRLRPDAPNEIDVNDYESKLPLKPKSFLIEKVYFIYKPKHDILIWQNNTDVGFTGKIEFYLSRILSDNFFVYSITRGSSLDKVLSGEVKYYEAKVAMPKTKLSNVPKYEQQTFDLMKGVGGATISYKISAVNGILNGNIYDRIKNILASDSTKSLKVKLAEDDEPIDLFVERISDRMSVDLIGHYPDPTDIFSRLNYAFDKNRSDLMNGIKKYDT